MNSAISKLFILLLLWECTYSQVTTQVDSIPNFRSVEWGESIDGVRSMEIAQYDQSYIGFGVYILTFHDKHLGYESKIDYVFDDDKLIEAFYTIETKSFISDYKNIKDYYIKRFGKPSYWASSHPDASIDWAWENEEDYCRGPEIYWEFCNGFLAIISERYKETISITILYAHNKTIEEYGKFVIYPY